MILHAGLAALRVEGRWRGALIAGSSGAGKSDLMLRAMDLGLRLVADDRTVVWTSGGRLYGRAPGTLAGLLEVRGLGVVRQPALPFAEVTLMAKCQDEPIERMPDPEAEEVQGVSLPVLRLHPREASAAAKLSYALRRLGQPLP